MLFREDEAARAQALQVRENVGWYLWTHDQVTLSGLDAEAFLDHMLVNRVAGLGVGRGRYTTMLNEEGRIIDDLVVTRVGEQEFWLSTLYGPHMVRWFDAHKGDADVTYADTTATWDMYSVQGPNAGTFMAELGVDVSELKRFQMVEATIVGKDVHIDRGGFTGELGYEIYVRRGEDSKAVYEALEAAGKKLDAPRLDILEVYVRSLPMEKGMALRQDYFGLTPYEAGLGWSVHMDKDFVGKEALGALEDDEDAPRRAFVGLELERESYEDIAQGEIVYKRGVPVGICRSMIYGYTVDKNIGFAIVDARKCPMGTYVKLGDNMSPAVVVEPKWI